MAVQSKLLECSRRGDHPRHEQIHLQLETHASMFFDLDVGDRERQKKDMYKSSWKRPELFFNLIHD